jgi:hypothetical protein
MYSISFDPFNYLTSGNPCKEFCPTAEGGVVAELFDKLFEMYSIQPCVIKFVSDLGQVYGYRGLLWIIRCPLSPKLTIAITEILMKVC